MINISSVTSTIVLNCFCLMACPAAVKDFSSDDLLEPEVLSVVEPALSSVLSVPHSVLSSLKSHHNLIQILLR